MDFSYLVLSSESPLSKRASLEAGKLVKVPAANLIEGEFTVKTVSSLKEFAAGLDAASWNQCHVYGMFKDGASSGRITAQTIKTKYPQRYASYHTRTKREMAWSSSGGVLFLDYDPPKGEGMPPPLSKDALIRALQGFAPFLDGVKLLWRPSSSSLLYNEETGEELSGVRGQRIYILVDDAREIPRIGKLIYELSWLAGFGYFEVGKAGQLLERGLFDASVWQPERQDFIGGMVCEPPVQQARLDCRMPKNGRLEYLAVALVPDLSPEQRTELWTIKAKAKAAVSEEAQSVRNEYIELRAGEMVSKLKGLSHEERLAALDAARRTVHESVEGGVLNGTFLLTCSNGRSVSVAELLAAPAKWNGARFFEPVEPGYGNDARIAWASLAGEEPYIFSHAHGGKRYQLRA